METFFTGKVSVADTIGVKDQPARARQCADWGVDMVYLHYGADQRRADGTRDSNQWIEQVKEATSVPIGMATFGAEDALIAARKGAALVAIGHPVVGTDSASFERLKDYVDRVKAACASSAVGAG